MPVFTSAPVASVAPKSKSANVGVRKAAFEQILTQVRTLVDTDVNDENRPSLIITLDESDKPLTVSQQLKRAATQLGISMYIRRKGETITAYKTGELEASVVEAAKPAKRGRKPKAPASA